MGIQDLIITPIYFFVFLAMAFVVKPWFTDNQTRRYFIPGLLAKFIGAIALGLIYQFYYGGGDTFTFHTHGSYWIWEAFMDNPLIGLELLSLDAGDYQSRSYKYAINIWQFRNDTSYFVIKIAALFDLLTFRTYSATSLFFAVFAFSGQWILFDTFSKIYPSRHKVLAISILFIPSVVFWGSGILKDSITMGALCWITALLFRVVLGGRNFFTHLILIIFFGWLIYSIKIYILLCFLAAASIFLYKHYSDKIRGNLVRIMAAPFIMLIFVGGAFLFLQTITEGDSRYSLDKISQTAKITAYDIRYGWGARQGENSGYTLGELDGSLGSLIRLAPNGIVVSLFRPWLWEVRNPLMLLAALESLFLLVVTAYVLFSLKPKIIIKRLSQAPVLFCLCFSLLFAVAVGVSTYNFGSLMRYKIPLMPYYFTLLAIITSKDSLNE